MSAKRNRIIIYVPGARALHSRTPLLQEFIMWAYGLFDFRPSHDDATQWIDFFEESGEYSKVIKLRWRRNILPTTLHRATKKLLKTIERHPEKEIYVVASSIGCEIALRAVEAGKKIRSIVLLSPVHEPRTIDSLPVTVFLPPRDPFTGFAEHLLYPSSWLFPELQGKQITIKKLDLRHDQFTPEQHIKDHETLGRVALEALSKHFDEK